MLAAFTPPLRLYYAAIRYIDADSAAAKLAAATPLRRFFSAATLVVVADYTLPLRFRYDVFDDAARRCRYAYDDSAALRHAICEQSEGAVLPPEPLIRRALQRAIRRVQDMRLCERCERQRDCAAMRAR